MDRYIINAGLRGDVTSRLARSERYGLFPTLSARWRVSGEKFLENVKQIDDLSFRLSYGRSGNAPKSDYTFIMFMKPSTGILWENQVFILPTWNSES
ncbi:TonB-dependent receptor [Niabella sp. W65]|nr:TonB-dependent receptor [Niabella sp. W65]MCH7363927.1 TonB-dependent receptor [Niabella sp. W65]